MVEFRRLRDLDDPAMDYSAYMDPEPGHVRVARLRRRTFAGTPYPWATPQEATVVTGTMFESHEVEDRFSPLEVRVSLEPRPRPDGLTLVFGVHDWRGDVGLLELEGAPGTGTLERGSRASLFKTIMTVAEPDRFRVVTKVPESSIFRANVFTTGLNGLNSNYDRDLVYYDGGDNNPQGYDSFGATRSALRSRR